MPPLILCHNFPLHIVIVPFALHHFLNFQPILFLPFLIITKHIFILEMDPLAAAAISNNKLDFLFCSVEGFAVFHCGNGPLVFKKEGLVVCDALALSPKMIRVVVIRFG